MSVSDKVLKLAFQGEWNTLLPILRDYPDLVNHPSEPKGYTPLHQAAWHGANLSVRRPTLMSPAYQQSDNSCASIYHPFF